MPNNIPIRIEQADLVDGAERELALPTGFSKHVLWQEYRGFRIIPAVIERGDRRLGTSDLHGRLRSSRGEE
jgi:hypothetical protein